MKIAVFCSSSNLIDRKYRDLAFDLGNRIATEGNTLVYGGATGGLMDAVAEGAVGGSIIGVIPKAVERMNRLSSLPTELISVSTMSERKARMKELADIFVVLPGSYGTLDEMLDVVASGIVGEHNKPLIIINQDGFYDLLLAQVEKMRQENFIPATENYKPLVVSGIDACMELFKSFENS